MVRRGRREDNYVLFLEVERNAKLQELLRITENKLAESEKSAEDLSEKYATLIFCF